MMPRTRWRGTGPARHSALLPLLRRINAYLMPWLRKKYKRLAAKKKARACWERVTAQYPRLFAHWHGALFLVNRMTGAV